MRGGTTQHTVLGGAVVAVVAAVGVAVAISLGGGRADNRPAPVNRAALQRRIERDVRTLARAGIYVTSTGQAATCVAVDVANPTAPNLDYLHRRYGRGMCFDRSFGPPHFCAGAVVPPPAHTAVVPDLRDLGVYEAGRHAVAAGFAYTLDCAGFGTRKPWHPARLSPAAASRVTAQCPLAGSRAPVNVPIALEAKAVLPGNFTYTISAFDASWRSPRCVHGWAQ